MMFNSPSLVVALLFFSVTYGNTIRASKKPTCKVFPGDSNWPSDSQWAALNKTTKGALIKTIPIAEPCYQGPLYNPDKCAFLAAQWTNSSLHMEDPTSIMSPLWQGLTCLPITNSTSNSSCTLGGYPSYALNATSVAHVQAGVNFARQTGIRLVVKNTGHDFSGKSAGAGALSIWTHHFKNIEYISHYNGDSEDNFSGPAFKAGTGVQAFEIYEAARERNLIVVGGEGKTVGIMGGYVQGGGHSPLSSLYGIAADHVLSLEVVLASGEFVTASCSKNPDLFWALRGGGGSTFGVVTSVTIKAYPDIPVTSFSFTFGGPGSGVTYDNFWAGVRAYFSHFIAFSDAGTYAYFWIYPAPVPIFQMIPFFAPNMTANATKLLLKPWLDELAGLGIVVSPSYTQYPGFYSAWSAQFPQEAVGTEAGVIGSRLWPRKNWQNETLLNETFAVYKQSIDLGLLTGNFNMAPRARGTVNNSVNPAWREAVLHSFQVAAWTLGDPATTILAQRQLLTDRQTAWRNASPGSGAYLGESDREEPNFQQSFYGSNYPRLLAIKQQIDPSSVFWAKTAVGSDAWNTKTSDILNDENGKLCLV